MSEEQEPIVEEPIVEEPIVEDSGATPSIIPAGTLPYLSEEELHVVFAELMRQESNMYEPLSINKQSYRDVVSAVDVWISDHMLEVENNIPQPGRSALSMTQKARIFFAVTKAKIGNF